MAPYRGGNLLLRAIHDLDILDKHNLILPVLSLPKVDAQIGGASISGCTFENVRGSPIRVVAENKVDSATVRPQITLGEGSELAGEELFPTLERLAQLVSDIVEAFAELLTGGGSKA